MARKAGPKLPETRAILKVEMVREYANTGRIGQTCEVVGITDDTHYEWLEADPEYAKNMAAAKRRFVEKLEAEADRRAAEGVNRPIYQGGKRVGTVKDFSDLLLIFRLKGEAPDKYKDRVANEHSGPNGAAIKVAAARQEMAVDKETLDVATRAYLERLRDSIPHRAAD